MTAAQKVRHPAKFTDSILDVMAGYLKPEMVVLDPFAGTGKIHLLGDRVGCVTVGIEIEPEWATLHPRTRQGDALALPFGPRSFDVVATSPTYGNRMADSHTPTDRDYCRPCNGLGRVPFGAGEAQCRKCGGSGRSKRNTYTHALGRKLHANNSGALQWGTQYRDFHRVAWEEAHRVLKGGGLFLLNVKDHVRRGRIVPVSAWHVEACREIGFHLEETVQVEVRGNREGANGAVRVPYEDVHVLRKPLPFP